MAPSYGEFNRYVTRSKHKRRTNSFYEYATISVVQDGVRLCVSSRPLTFLDVQVDVVRELVEEAERRGVKIKLVLLDRAFFAVVCINLLKGLGLKFVMPCACNERVQREVDSFGREGRLPFPTRDSHQAEEASFTIVACWSEKNGKLIPLATNVEGNARRLVRTIPKEYRRR